MLVILETFFRRCDLSFLKLGQWSKKWQVVSISKPQRQLGLRESSKSCLNFWSRRRFKPRRNLVICLIPLVLKQLYVLIGKFLINFKIHFKKLLRLLELRKDLSRSFHSIIRKGKKQFFRKLYLKWKKGIFLAILYNERWFKEVVTHKDNVKRYYS